MWSLILHKAKIRIVTKGKIHYRRISWRLFLDAEIPWRWFGWCEFICCVIWWRINIKIDPIKCRNYGCREGRLTIEAGVDSKETKKVYNSDENFCLMLQKGIDLNYQDMREIFIGRDD